MTICIILSRSLFSASLSNSASLSKSPLKLKTLLKVSS